MPLYLTQGLHRAVQSHPDRIATIFEQRQRTYREYAERVARLASALQQLGMTRGDRVAMLALNSDRYLEFFFGTWWAGGAVNPVNCRWTAAEVVYSLDDCDTRILLVDDKFKDTGADIRSLSKTVKTLIYTGDGETPAGMLNYETLLAQASPVDDSGCAGNDLAAVMYTGGTTGFPKGVMLSHENLASNALSVAASGCVAADGRALLIAPMFHIACGALMNGQSAMGGTFVIAPAFTAQGTLSVIQQHRATHILLVPAMIQLATDCPDASRYDLSSVKTILYGGSVISEGVLERAMKLFCGADFIQAYGMTELSPCVAHLSPADHRSGKPGILRSAGRANLTSEVRVVDENDVEVPYGEVGEVVARGPGVMLGYWNKPELTAATVRNGWMHTGDGGVMNADGYLYIVDRLKDMIVSGGENIYSAEVENVLSQHPAVAACAIIGIPSDKWGEAVHAVVVLKPIAAGATAPSAIDLIAHCKQLIASYKCPRSVEFRTELPMTGAGKVQKSELRKSFWEGCSRAVN